MDDHWHSSTQFSSIVNPLTRKESAEEPLSSIQLSENPASQTSFGRKSVMEQPKSWLILGVVEVDGMRSLLQTERLGYFLHQYLDRVHVLQDTFSNWDLQEKKDNKGKGVMNRVFALLAFSAIRGIWQTSCNNNGNGQRWFHRGHPKDKMSLWVTTRRMVSIRFLQEMTKSWIDFLWTISETVWQVHSCYPHWTEWKSGRFNADVADELKAKTGSPDNPGQVRCCPGVVDLGHDWNAIKTKT